MKRIILAIIFTLIIGIVSNAAAQTPSEDGIRIRSGELARVKRMGEVELNSDRKIDIAEVKKYFEGIQTLQDTIVRAYSTGQKIDYAKISKSSAKLNEMAVKLKAVLFSSAEQVSDKTKKNGFKNEKDVKELVIGLDYAIGRFVINPIFQSQKTDVSKDLEKARTDLSEIINLSEALRSESKRQKTLAQ